MTALEFPEIEGWLNGWSYTQEGILSIYSQESCVGCGYKFPLTGTACWAIDPNIPDPNPPKGFPFNMQTCPLCKLRNRNQVLEKRVKQKEESRGDALTRRLVALREASK